MKPTVGTLANPPSDSGVGTVEDSGNACDSFPDAREHLDKGDRWSQFQPVTALLIAATCLPWLAGLAAHYAAVPEEATGFIQYDQPYYVANGRAVFERGNSLTHPNPYDPDPAAPAIYFHWLTWLLGFSVTVCGFDPGTVYVVVGLVTLPYFGWLTWQLVGERMAARRLTRGDSPPDLWQHSFLFVLAIWGGGLLTLAGFASYPFGDQSPGEAALRFDPFGGMWFLNWGRNAIFTSEIVYHCLVAACWLNVLRGRSGLALVFGGLLAATHPWSGLELLLTLNVWFASEAVRIRNRHAVIRFVAAFVMLAGLLSYYKLWLPSYPSHAALQHAWNLNWSMSTMTAVLAYGPVATLAGLSVSRGHFVLRRPGDRFLLLAAFVALSLTLHDRFLPDAIQPLHFSRGYVWMPLFLLSIPGLLEIPGIANRKQHHRPGTGGVRRLFVCALILAVGCMDNLVFSVIHAQREFTGASGFRLNAADRSLLRDLHNRVAGEVVVCESVQLSYLMPVYANVRPWLGHKYNTPDFESRRTRIAAILQHGEIPESAIPPDTGVFVCRRSRNTDALVRSPNWLMADIRNPDWLMWTRVTKSDATAANSSHLVVQKAAGRHNP